jgi:mRNA interferase RelE/StbE
VTKECRRELPQKLKEYASEPLRYAKKLISPKMGEYKFRIGDYRIIFDIEGENIVILRVRHRKSIYK